MYVRLHISESIESTINSLSFRYLVFLTTHQLYLPNLPDVLSEHVLNLLHQLLSTQSLHTASPTPPQHFPLRHIPSRWLVPMNGMRDGRVPEE